MTNLPDTPQEWLERAVLAGLLIVVFVGVYLQADRVGQRLGGVRKPRWPWGKDPS
jgi:hypothetical protein